MTHIALYRSWRPQAFGDMVGQQFVTRTLQNALREGRFSHAYLFSGPRGTGKTSAAKILAKAVNCENGPAEEPCNQCSSCQRITDGTIMDVLEIDAASNRGVEEIRDIRDKIRFAPTEVRRKVYIIDEVHMLTTEAFNALLKTLEEPPEHVMFILATTEPHRLPATIISRCQRFDFKRISLEEQVSRLRRVCDQENIQIEDEALQYIARLSDGGMRDALSLLDQVSSFCEGVVQLEDVLTLSGGVSSEQFQQLAISLLNNEIGEILERIDQWMQDGKSADKCLESMIIYFRDLLLVKMMPNGRTVLERISNASTYETVASRFRQEDLLKMIEVLNGYMNDIKNTSQPQTLLEVAMMKVSTMIGNQQTSSELASYSGIAIQTPQEVVTTVEKTDIQQLQHKVEALEQQVSQLMVQLKQMTTVNGTVSNTEQQPAVTQPTTVSRASAPPRHSNRKLDHFLQPDATKLKTLAMNWGQLLAKVKEKRITVHAWFVDGEPVSIANEEILVAFKSAMHRETTEKPANRQLIEQTMNEVFGMPMQLVTVMIKEWEQIKDQVKPQEGSSDGTAASANTTNPEWVDAAIELFGENLVEIKDE